MIETSNQPGVPGAGLSVFTIGGRGRAPTSRPLIAVKSNKQLDEEKNAREAQATELYLPSESALAGHIRKAWQTNKIYKNRVALRLLACLRARRGVYSQNEAAQVEANGGANIVWVDLTETKCRAGAAWLREVLMPPQDLPFDLEPSPMPDLPIEVKVSITQAAAAKAQKRMVAQYQQAMQQWQASQQQQQGGGPSGPPQLSGPGGPPGAPPATGAPLPPQPPGPPMSAPAGAAGAAPEAPSIEEFRELARQEGERMVEAVRTAYMTAARAAADRMRAQVEKRMIAGGWDKEFDDFLEDFVTYPTAFLKGPYFQRGARLAWSAGFIPTIDTSPQQTWKRIDPFDAYPAPWSQDCQRGDFIERVRFDRKTLYSCIGVDTWKEEAVRAALRDYTNGHLEGWLWTEAERQRLQQDTMYTWLSPAGIIDGLQFWGSVPGWMLMSWGVTDKQVDDPEKDYEISAVLIGPYVVQCSLNPDPLDRRPYRCASYDAIPGAIWGRSIYDLGMTSQKMVNAAGCALADNLGWASGFQTWVHVDRMADGESSLEVFPGRIWQLKSDPTQGANPGIGFFQPDTRAAELMNVIEKWTVYADDSTGIPRYTYGNENVTGAAETYSGLAMLMNNAAKGLRRAISAIDKGVIEPSVWDCYVQEMLNNPDRSLKCDANVVPKGAVSILVKEAQSQARLQALQVTGANPIDLQIIGMKGRAEQLRQALAALEIPSDGIVPDDAAIEEQMRAQQAQQDAMMAQQQQQAMAAQQAQQAAQAANEDFQQRQLALKQHEIDQQGQIEGAKLAQKATAERDRQNAASERAASSINFQYGPDGRISGASRAAPPKGPPPAGRPPAPQQGAA